MNEWIVLLLSIPIHELGHYIAFRILGYKPDIKLSFGAILIGENVLMKVKAKEIIMIALAGILAGLSFLFIFNISSNKISTEIIYLYFILCMIDIVTIWTLVQDKKYWNLTSIERLKKIVEEHDKERSN